MAETKSPDAFRTISEVAALVGVEQHVLRFWETKFPAIKPVKRAGGRRYYRRQDVELLGGIRQLLKEDMLSIKGVQRVLAEKGVAHVAALAAVPGLTPDTAPPSAEADAAPEAPAPAAAPRPEMPDLPGDLDLPPAPCAPPMGGSAGRAALTAWLAEARALRDRLEA